MWVGSKRKHTHPCKRDRGGDAEEKESRTGDDWIPPKLGRARKEEGFSLTASEEV